MIDSSHVHWLVTVFNIVMGTIGFISTVLGMKDFVVALLQHYYGTAAEDGVSGNIDAGGVHTSEVTWARFLSLSNH